MQNCSYFCTNLMALSEAWEGYASCFVLFPQDCFGNSGSFRLWLFNHQVVSNSLWPHGLQHTRPSGPSSSPRVCPSSYSLNRWCHPTISSSVALFSSCLSLSQHQGLFQWVSCLHLSWSFSSKYWNFSFSISPSSEYSGLISFRIDWFDLAFQGTLKSLLQRQSLKASVFWCSAFFIVQLSHLYVTAGETIALTIRTFIGQVMSLLFNTLSRFVIAFLPRSSHLLV